MVKISKDIKIFLTFFLIFSFFSQWISWNEFSRFALTKSIIEENTLNIDSFYNETGDRSYYKNHYYTDKPPGMSFLATPIYKLWEIVHRYYNPQTPQDTFKEEMIYYVNDVAFTYYPNPGSFELISMFLITTFTSSLISALTVLLLYKISKYFTNNELQRILLASIYGLGTLAFPHSLVFTGHAVETFFGFLSFYLLFKFKKNPLQKRIPFLAGIFLGFGIVVGYSILLISIICLLYAMSIRKDYIYIFVIGTSIGLLPLIVYNYSIFSNPLDFAGRLEYIETISIPQNLKKIYINQNSGILSTVQNFIRLKSTSIPIILQILIFPSKGIFFYYPILIFSIIGIVYIYKKYRIESVLLLFLFILFICIIPFQVLIWWGAFSGFGLRYLLPTIPFLMIPLAELIKKINYKLLIIPLVISIFVNFLLLQYGEDAISSMNPSEYENKLKTFEVLSNPLINHYLPLFSYNGPRSILFENLILNKKIDIRLTPHSCGLTPPVIGKTKINLLTLKSIGILSLKTPFISLIPISIIILAIWKKEILKKIRLNGKSKIVLSAGLILIFILMFFETTNVSFDSGWYSPEFHNGKIGEYQWMTEKSSLTIFNSDQKDWNKLNFNIKSFNKSRRLEIYINDKLVLEDMIKSEWINKEIPIEQGVNKIKFKSDGCDRPTQLGIRECDFRCISFKIGDIVIS